MELANRPVVRRNHRRVTDRDESGAVASIGGGSLSALAGGDDAGQLPGGLGIANRFSAAGAGSGAASVPVHLCDFAYGGPDLYGAAVAPRLFHPVAVDS